LPIGWVSYVRVCRWLCVSTLLLRGN